MTLYATRIPRALVASHTDADALHQFTMSLYRSADLPGAVGERRSGANILWRLDGNGILVTADQPATDLPEGAATTTFEPAQPTGRLCRFIVTVDVVARVRGKATRVTDVDAWFATKAAGALTDMVIHAAGSIIVYRRGAPLEQVSLAGSAVVADPDALSTLIREGVGRSKAFGCGMLTVAHA